SGRRAPSTTGSCDLPIPTPNNGEPCDERARRVARPRARPGRLPGATRPPAATGGQARPLALPRLVVALRHRTARPRPRGRRPLGLPPPHAASRPAAGRAHPADRLRPARPQGLRPAERLGPAGRPGLWRLV